MTLLALLLLLVPAARDDAFAAANAAYQDGHYADAARAYRQILAGGDVSAALLHNLGSALVQLDSVGAGLVYLERAARLDPDEAAYRHSLSVARQRAGVPLDRLPLPPLHHTWTWLALDVGPHVLFGAGLVLLVAACLLVGLRQRTRTAWTRRGLLATAPMAAVLLVAAFLASAGAGVGRRAVVAVGTDAAVGEGTRTLASGTPVWWLGGDAVRLPDGHAARLDAGALGLVDL